MYNDLYKELNIDKKVYEFVSECEEDAKKYFDLRREIYEYNQLKVLKAFLKNKISESHFFESTGYGYTDIGRDVIEKVFCDIFNTEDALVRMQFVSGTHAISNCLLSITNANDNVLSITGMPYDTLLPVIGTKNEYGSLKYNKVNFDYLDLLNDDFDYNLIEKTILSKNINVIMIQRSKGYSKRHSFSSEEIGKVIDFIKKINDKIIIFVDNCYGEFVGKFEPTDFGADIMAGSLIKNIGGSLVKSGGYIVGKADLIEKCSYRLTSPGLGKEVGISFNENRSILQGLTFAPSGVYNSLLGTKLFSIAYNKFNYNTYPKFTEEQNDLVIAIELKDKNKLINFCENIQSSSYVDSFVKPEFSDMPGYDSKIIMAAGTFISGSSIELSCDGPLKEPYLAFLQGGTSYFQLKYALMKCLKDEIK